MNLIMNTGSVSSFFSELSESLCCGHGHLLSDTSRVEVTVEERLRLANVCSFEVSSLLLLPIIITKTLECLHSHFLRNLLLFPSDQRKS